MSQSGKLLPNLDQQSTKALNLTVLQRIDPFVEEILITASHVTVYLFNVDIKQWSRKDVEGSLFVIKRNTQPRFQFVVMNRRNVDNLVEDLLGGFEYEVQLPYLFYRNASQEVNGVWFYNSHDCVEVANLFNRILSAFSKVPPKFNSTKSSEFEEVEAVPSLDVIEGPLEPPVSSSAMSVADVPDNFLMNFFSAAMNIGNVPNTAITGQLLQASSTVPLAPQTSSVTPSTLPTIQSASSLSSSAIPFMPILDAQKSFTNGIHATNLLKPSFFSPSSSSSLMMPPIASSKPTAPRLHPPVTMQHPYGTPLLQPFPPPAPYITPAPSGRIITKEKVRDALLRLVQNNQFIDMVYREMLNAHGS